MKELINNELAQLQKDLENLQSASKMISQAGEASNNVIAEAKGIHEDFSKNLEKLTSLYTQYLEAANKQSSQNQLLVVDHIKKTISEESALLDKYSKLVENANTNTQSLYDKAVASQKDSLSKLAAETTSKIDTVKDTYLKQSAETDKLLSSYLELAQSTVELKNKIESVDFPSRLDTLSKAIVDFTEQQKVEGQKLDKIIELASSDKELKQAQANAKTLKSIKSIAVTTMIIIILAIAGAGYLYFKGRM